VLGDLRNTDAVPALISALRDPVVSVAAWANDALGKIGDKTALQAVQRYLARLRSLAAAGRIPQSAGAPDTLIAQAAATCFKLGDEHAENELVTLLLSEDPGARTVALAAMRDRYGMELEYDPYATLDERRAAVAAWLKREKP
jgi:HEAT repeat protein